MRTVPAPWRAGATTLAHAWRLMRRDGLVLGFTDHDRDLVVAGVACRAVVSGADLRFTKSAGFEPDASSLSGVLSIDSVGEDELAAGRWDGARIDVWRVDWRDTADAVHVFAGRIGAVRRGTAAFTAEVRGLQSAFETAFGRVFAGACDADVGDARCGVALDAPSVRGAGGVLDRIDDRVVSVSGLGAFVDGWFTRGVLTWSDGARCTVLRHAAGETAILELALTARDPGAVFTVTAGCDKRFATCRAKFANTVNFRGFPDMPGTDAVVAGADRSVPMDGGSRRR